MSASIHPVVAATLCKHCGGSNWRLVRSRTVHEVFQGRPQTVNIEEYECNNDGNGLRRAKLSWAYPHQPRL